MMQSELEYFIAEDLGEDIYPGIAGNRHCRAVIKANEPGVIVGISEACQIFKYFDNTEITHRVTDGVSVEKNTIILETSGRADGILKGERLALNFIGRMSGIATLTNTFKKLSGKTVIAATRKTTPGFRKFEKKAVILGGGDPHRYNLSDMVMVKDNHIKLLGIEQAVKNAKKIAGFTRKIEIEIEQIKDAVLVARLGVDIIMLDNCTPEQIRTVMELLEKENLREKITLEASGNINTKNIKEYTATGVDVISIGSLTHSAAWLDVSMSILD
ncbi:MAG: carboxylating nicotinate-nucleotide diphosphorylase [Methanosarcinales archaeon]|nr:MAG: carboxylating nicotinate-nucleotide diphosphorylase [Methanosarcinales archaeon]